MNTIDKFDFPVYVQYSNRCTLVLQVSGPDKVIVKAPHSVSTSYICNILEKKQSWIQKRILEYANKQTLFQDLLLSSTDPKKAKSHAKHIIASRTQFFSSTMGVMYSSLRCSSARTRWGSCSGTNTISINWRLVLLPPQLLDYVIIHELAHITHKNHSKQFWSLVAKYCSDYKEKRKMLHSYSAVLEYI
jgi:predicted metal-dependent hydrolase